MKPKNDFTKIKKILKWVWENPNSSFYRDKYKKAGIKSWKEIKNMDDFKKLPYLTREEIFDTDPFDRTFLSKNKINIAATTSGTSNKPLVLFNEVYEGSLNKLNESRKIELRYMKNQKVERLFLLNPLSIFTARIQYYKAWKELCHVFGDISNLPMSAKVAATTRIQAISSNSTILLFFAPYLEKEYNLNQIKYISLGGEYCSKQRLKLLKKFFPKAMFYFRFSSREAVNRSYQCDNQVSKAPGIFHWDPTSYPELAKDEELIFTTFQKTMFPAIRYKTGDGIIFKNRSCACGSKDRVFEVIGRLGYDSLRIQGTTIHVESIMNAMQNAPGIIKGDFKLHVYEDSENNAVLPRLVLEIVKAKNTQASIRSIENIISDKLYLSGKMTLSELVKRGVFKPLKVKLVDQLPFEQKRKYIVPHNN